MKPIVKVLILFMTVATVVVGCEKSPDSWPTKVRATLYVPEKHDYIKYYKLEGSYQVVYKANVCWPAEDFINAFAQHMSSLGWQRLREDFLNPGLKLPWTREKHKQWGAYEDQKGMVQVHQWIDDWEDKDSSIVRYGLRYTTKKENGYSSTTSRDCNLDAVVIYIPKEVRPNPTDLDAMKKQH